MRSYARHYAEDEELWGITGLLHDLDYERHPDMNDKVNGHPRTELRLFRERDYPPELVHAVEAHATFLGVSGESLLDKTLLAQHWLANVGPMFLLSLGQCRANVGWLSGD